MATKNNSRSSIRIARIYGIDVRIHWTFLALVLFVVWAEWASGLGQVGIWLLWIAAVFGSVLVHEFAHCVVARRRGAVVEDILLLPIGGVSQMEKIPEAPGDELAIALVGPLTSLGLGLLAVAGGLAVGARMWPPTLFAGPWLARLAWLNFALGAFNLVPALPMDGGRILRAALARHRDRREATRLAGKIARFLAGVMIVGGLLYDFWFALIGVFVWLGAVAEEQAAQTKTRDHADDHGPSTTSPSPPPWPPPSLPPSEREAPTRR
ncbi:MAG TPA: site-2 protease family protein [Acidimicrobiales bacterium]|jgi:Zn-dependent protease